MALASQLCQVKELREYEAKWLKMKGNGQVNHVAAFNRVVGDAHGLRGIPVRVPLGQLGLRGC